MAFAAHGANTVRLLSLPFIEGSIGIVRRICSSVLKDEDALRLTRGDLTAIAALFFSGSTEEEYAPITDSELWSAFAHVANPQPVAFLAAFPLPLSYEDYRHFFNLVLTPGMPGAVLPVESLYKPWREAERIPMAQRKGFYLGSSALHVTDLCNRLAIEIPPAYTAKPDHVLLLVELLEFLRAHAPEEDARDFAARHFDWLAAYRAAFEARRETERDERIRRALEFYEGISYVFDRFAEEGGVA